MSTEEKLRELGDPSGKQDSTYWNEWFQIVCGDDHRSFEWYTAPSEVARVLQSFQWSVGENPRMIHPGSGNSLTPVKLRDDYSFPHKHVVVEIADVALEEMKRVHDNLSGGENPNSIEYLLGDVLHPPLPLDDDSFDIWVDKGLLDALFNDCETLSERQCNRLFEEAFRLLRPGSGLLFIVTMAEDHSLSLMLDNWSRLWNDEKSMWKQTLIVHELEPLSGDMRPFGFSMTKESNDLEGREGEKRCLLWHPIAGVTEQVELGDDVYESIKRRCEHARQQFRSQLGQSSDNMMLATIEIKPWDTEVDLYAVGRVITRTNWVLADGRQIDLKWQPFNEDGKDIVKIVAIGYGISKLVLKCTLDSHHLDDLTDAIREWDGIGVAEDGIQSVDVDWNQSFHIGDLSVVANLKKAGANST